MTEPGDDQAATMAAETADAPTEFRESLALAEAQAWSVDDDVRDVRPSRASWVRVAFIAAAIAATAAAAIGGIVAWWPRDASPAASGQIGPAPAPSWPVTAADMKFVNEMHRRGMTVSNLQWYAERGRAVCRSFNESRSAPGAHSIEVVVGIISEDEKNWDSGQSRNFVASALEAYCPQMFGPSPEAIAKLPPDDRYVALTADRLGWALGPADVAANTTAARNQCAALQAGTPREDLVRTVSAGSDQVNPQMARELVDIAVEVYCPAVR